MTARFHLGNILALTAVLLTACATDSELYRRLSEEAYGPLSELSLSSAVELPEPWRPSPGLPDLFEGKTLLRLEELLLEVQRRNPTLSAMQSAWRAAVSRYPQVTSLDDPNVSYAIAPRTIGRPEVGSGMSARALAFGQKIDLSQRFPWPGKLELRGEIALYGAQAAREDIEIARQRLIREGKHSYFEFYFLHRAIAINATNLALLENFRTIAEAKYGAGTASKQNVLQAEVEHDHLLHHGIVLERMLNVTRARLNTLLNRSPELPLPSPPEEIALPEMPEDVAGLRVAAINGRPELQAIAARIRSGEASIALARKEYFPDFTVMGTYNSVWQETKLRPMIGVGFNVPIRTGRRRAAVKEAQARTDRLKAELASGISEVSLEVQVAHERLTESRHVVALYASQLLPASEENLNAALSGYETGELDFLTLITAQRGFMDVELAYHEATVAYQQRFADLERAVGEPISADAAALAKSATTNSSEGGQS